jgi:TRAP-type mannitol/chloroaromatic compound transport system permease small subunit
MGRLKLVLNSISLISVWTGKITSLATLAMMLTIVYDVVARYYFMRPTLWAEETDRFLLTGYFLLGGAYCLYYKGHVRMDVLYDHLSPRGKAIMDLFTAIVFFTIMVILTRYGWEAAWLALKNMERTESAWAPLTFPMKMAAPVGCFLMLLQGLAQFIRDLITAITGKEFRDVILG